jgi:hypothetical protein
MVFGFCETESEILNYLGIKIYSKLGTDRGDPGGNNLKQ